MNRVALVVGVRSYLYEEELPGTELDARSFYDALTDNTLGEYDPNLSKLLISPTYNEIKSALENTLFNNGPIDTFTFFFAGHGIWSKGYYYLFANDSRVDRLTLSALQISYVFSLLNEAQPKQSNIVIDACNAGGFVGDLAALLKPEAFGDASTPGVTLFASSMRNEYAREVDNGGLASQSLLRIIRGEEALDHHTPYLDLSRIGTIVSEEIQAKYPDQTPVVWSFNITGFSKFSKNPHYIADESEALWEPIVFHRRHLNIPKETRESLWDAYLRLTNTGEMSWLVERLSECARQVEDADITPMLFGLIETFPSRAGRSNNRLAEVEALAACAVAALPSAETDAAPQLLFRHILDRLQTRLEHLFNQIAEEAVKNEFLFLSHHSAMSDLFFLPVRLSKILGWMGLYDSLKTGSARGISLMEPSVKSLRELIVERYSGSLVAIAEEQSPYIYSYGYAVKRHNEDEGLATPLSCWINDFIRRKGQTAEYGISGADALRYLISECKGSYEQLGKIVARPTELGTVLLFWASQLDFDAEVDPFMREIDHLALNSFIPTSLYDFGGKQVPGANVGFSVGSETGDGIFHMEDLRRVFERFCVPRLNATRGREDDDLLTVAMLASFLLPDRVCWPAYVPPPAREISVTGPETHA